MTILMDGITDRHGQTAQGGPVRQDHLGGDHPDRQNESRMAVNILMQKNQETRKKAVYKCS